MQIFRVLASNFRIRFGNKNLPFTYIIYLSVVVRNVITSRFTLKPSSVKWTWKTRIFGSFNNFFVFCHPLTTENMLHWAFFAVVITPNNNKVNRNFTITIKKFFQFFFFQLYKNQIDWRKSHFYDCCPLRMNSFEKKENQKNRFFCYT